MSKYEKTIGLEVHVELKTQSKIFSSSANTYGMDTNTCVNVVDLGYPGTLPTINEEVLKIGVKAAHILHCNITKRMHFDRKNYFYPDNPKNYQITQSRTPIGTDGYVEIELDGEKKKIGIEEIHIEEDTCKSAHRGKVSLLDFNRAGVPLLEIVSKPCMKNKDEAIKYLEKLKELLFYGDISDCKMEEGSMRCDANVSLSKEVGKLGTKCEVKNMGSIHSVGEAIEIEEKRQQECLEKGEVIKEQTRRYDEKKKATILMRVKETGNDYRYFPEPDIPFVVLEDSFIKEAIETLPLLPDELRKIYQEKGLSKTQIEKIIANRPLSNYFNQLLENDINHSLAANLLLGDIAAYLNKKNLTLDQTKLGKNRFLSLIQKMEDGSLSSKNLKEILDEIMESEKAIDDIMKEKGIQNIKDDTVILQVIEKVMQENEASVKDYLEGKDRALKYLMGQVMKETKGSVNPKMANDLLIEKLKERSV
mgnify:CR=1 FL=1